MTIGDQLLSNFPNTIKKDSFEFQNIVANDKQTGVFESVLNTLNQYIKQYTGTPDIYEQTGEMLDKTVEFLSYLEKFTDETEEALKLRISAIFKRNGDTVFGTPYDIRNVFRQYFPSAKIYLTENVGDVTNTDNNHEKHNLIKDFDFQSGLYWDFSSPDIRTVEARFSKTYGLKLLAGDSAKQQVELINKQENYSVVNGDTYSSIAKFFYGAPEKGSFIQNYDDNPETLVVGQQIKIPAYECYFLHFFLSGNCNITVKDISNNKYWNCETLSWESAEVQNKFVTPNKNIQGTYANGSVVFSLDTPLDENITIPSNLILEGENGLRYYTTGSVDIEAGETESSAVGIQSEKQGFINNSDINTINTIVSETPYSMTVTNPNPIIGGTDDWKDQSLYFFTDYTMDKVEISINGETFGCVDYVRMYKKLFEPSFAIIAHFEGNANDEAMALANGNRDDGPVTNLVDGATDPAKYGNYSYYDGAFLTGVSSGYAQDIYADLLEYVRSIGVKAYINIINRDFIER